jgi:hypothetical protein
MKQDFIIRENKAKKKIQKMSLGGVSSQNEQQQEVTIDPIRLQKNG